MKTPFILITILLLIIIRGVVVILHELGHAISIILLTKKGATVYIGSYGDDEKSIRFKIKSLILYFSYNPIYWKNGLCIPHAEEISNTKKIIYILAGPLCSFTFASIFFFLIISYRLNDTYFHIGAVFLFLAIVDLLYNLVPNQNEIKLDNGDITYNDGYNLTLVLKEKRNLKKYITAIDTYSNQKYDTAIILFHDFLDRGVDSDITYRFLISSHLQLKQYNEAKKLVDESILKYPQNSDDFTNAGLIYSFLGFHEKALKFYTDAIEINALNATAINNKGYTYNLLNQYDKAIPLFDKAIEINPNFAYSYNNRGLSKMKIGKIEEGQLDIEKSIEIDPENSYSYKNLGIYNYDKGNYTKALELFYKAQIKDASTHEIEKHIAQVKNKLS